VHQLVNNDFDNIKMHGTTVKISYVLFLHSLLTDNFFFFYEEMCVQLSNL
jgi:hypothetical protein